MLHKIEDKKKQQISYCFRHNKTEQKSTRIWIVMIFLQIYLLRDTSTALLSTILCVYRWIFPRMIPWTRNKMR